MPSNAASIATGQQLYQKYCRFCHGATGAGDGPSAPKDMKPSNLTDATWDRGSTDGEIFIVIQEGAGPEYKMKGLKGKLSDQDTWHVVNYVRSLGGAEAEVSPPEWLWRPTRVNCVRRASGSARCCSHGWPRSRPAAK